LTAVRRYSLPHTPSAVFIPRPPAITIQSRKLNAEHIMKCEKDFDARINQDLTRLMEQARTARADISNLKVGKERS
jgi:hypothetical protein